ncbi:MAG: hypothetical protein IJ583_18120 [Firmicutes bacterium]|nr:hypothetical protein [Bacillota bacterium]MBR1445442.1 hypothetical protein [Bacillota bacterium]
MASLKDSVKNQTVPETTKTAVNAFKSNKEKNKMISAYVDIDRYEKFKAINDKRGISNNKILNLMIADYVLQYEKLLEN